MSLVQIAIRQMTKGIGGIHSMTALREPGLSVLGISLLKLCVLSGTNCQLSQLRITQIGPDLILLQTPD